MQNPESLTGHYLTGLRQIEVPRLRREGHPGQEIRILGATANNLQKVDAAIPLGTFTCVTGVSGSGQSTLILETLYNALPRRLHKARALPATNHAIEALRCNATRTPRPHPPTCRTPPSHQPTHNNPHT